MKNTAFLPNSLDGPELDLLVEPRKSGMEEERDEARAWAIYLRRVVKAFWANDWNDEDWAALIGQWAAQPDWLKEKS